MLWGLLFLGASKVLSVMESVLKATARRISRGVVLKRHLPEQFGRAPLFVSPESALGFWRRDVGEIDPLLFHMVGELVRPQSVVWDIGANSGLFSFAAATTASQVLAVEPDLWLAQLLNRSQSLNKLPVTVLPAAVSDSCQITSLHISENGRASNSLGGNGRSQGVVTVTLDWILDHFPAPQVLKIDVEGWEYEVLRGAPRVLRSEPVIFCEVTRNHEEVTQLLTEAGYILYGARQKERKPLRRASYDTLAIPRSQV